MVIVKAIFSNFLAFLMSFILTVLPSAPLRAPVIETLESDCLLNIEVLSDTHIESKSPLRKAMLRGGLKNISKAKSPVDAVIVTGDITNYADEPSLAVFSLPPQPANAKSIQAEINNANNFFIFFYPFGIY